MSDPIQDKAAAFVTVISALTLRRVFMATLAGILVIFGYSAWETRAAVMAAIIASPSILWVVGAGVVLLTIGFIVHALIKRIDEMNQKRVEELSTRLKEVEDELIECKVSCKAEAVATHEAIKVALARIEQKLEK